MDRLCRFLHACSHWRRPKKCLRYAGRRAGRCDQSRPEANGECVQWISAHQIGWMRTFHARSETYRAAQASVTEAHTCRSHSQLWGNGTTASSDGQFFRASDRTAKRGDINLHYSSEPGSKFYSHLSDQYGYFSILPISPTEARQPMCSMGYSIRTRSSASRNTLPIPEVRAIILRTVRADRQTLRATATQSQRPEVPHVRERRCISGAVEPYWRPDQRHPDP